MKEHDSSIGARLKQERERLGLTQAEMADLVGATSQSQYNWERGESYPNAGYLKAIVAEGADLEFILFGKPLRPCTNTACCANFNLLHRFVANTDARAAELAPNATHADLEDHRTLAISELLETLDEIDPVLSYGLQQALYPKSKLEPHA